MKRKNSDSPIWHGYLGNNVSGVTLGDLINLAAFVGGWLRHLCRGLSAAAQDRIAEALRRPFRGIPLEHVEDVGQGKKPKLR